MRTSSTICLPPEDHTLYKALAKKMFLPFSLFIQRAIETTYRKQIAELKEEIEIKNVMKKELKVEIIRPSDEREEKEEVEEDGQGDTSSIKE